MPESQEVNEELLRCLIFCPFINADTGEFSLLFFCLKPKSNWSSPWGKPLWSGDPSEALATCPPRLKEPFLFSGSQERAGNPQATWVLPLGRFLLLANSHSYPRKKLPFCSFTAPIPAALPYCQAPLQQLGPLEFSCKPPS